MSAPASSNIGQTHPKSSAITPSRVIVRHVTQQRSALVRAEATAVLGEYDHAVDFPQDKDFVIVYGPNGVGKTKFLEILHAVSKVDGRSLSQLPFNSARLEYSNGSELAAIRVWTKDDENQDLSQSTISFTLSRDGHELSTWDYTGESFEDWVVANTPWQPFNEPDGIWEDRRDGELVHIVELKHRYPEGERRRRREDPLPPELEEFRRATASYLIETQRLRIALAQPQTNRSRVWSASLVENRSRHASRISEHAAKMKSLVNDAQTEHSTITQQLDRTFPNRVLELADAAQDAGSSTVPDADTVRRRYEEQNEFRSRLGRVASVALADALSLPDRDLEDWELRLLGLYLDDADTKLAPFEILLQKIELLEEILNARLLNKKLQVTAREGLSVHHSQDDREIDLDALSSGEQHEIILMFDLLFNVPEGALVLIDEPEISLHVIWQLAFIPDVQKIAELAGFRFIVATHSPQIINDAWDQAVRLGPEEVRFS